MANILIVDDNAQVRRMLGMMLKKTDHQLQEAPDGIQALAHINAHPTDLAIVDILLPEKDGIETIEEIRKTRPDIKIIAISGGGRVAPREYLQMARILGAERTIAKPIEAAELQQAVRELLGESQPPE